MGGSKTKQTTRQLKKAMITALSKNMGIIKDACEKVGIDRATFYNYKKRDPKFKKEYEDIVESVIDFAESSLMKQIDSGNTTATIFFLKTRAKHRGYIEANISINHEHNSDLSKYTDKELDNILKYGYAKLPKD